MFWQCAQLRIIAIGQTMVMLVAGLDLSVGGVIVMTSIVAAEVSNARNEMIQFAILIALIVGMLIRLFNSLLITLRKVTPLLQKSMFSLFRDSRKHSLEEYTQRICPRIIRCGKQIMGIYLHST